MYMFSCDTINLIAIPGNVSPPLFLLDLCKVDYMQNADIFNARFELNISSGVFFFKK